MFVRQLTTNFSSPDGQPHTFELGQHTILKARNGGYKSTLSHALRLLMSETTDDVNGKDEVKDPQVLAQFMPAGVDELFVHGIMDDGAMGAWGTKRTEEGTIKAPLPEPVPGVDASRVLPLRSIRATVQGDRQVARKTFLGWIGQKTTLEDVLVEIPSHLHARYKDMQEKKTGTPTERLALVIDYVQQRAREIEADAAAQDNLIQALGVSLQNRPSPEEIERVRTLVQQWSAGLAQAIAAETRPTGDMEQARNSVQTAEQTIAQWEAHIAEHEAHRPVQPSAQARPDIRRHKISAELLDEAQCATGRCPTCGATPGEPSLRQWAQYHIDSAQEMAEPPEMVAYRSALATWEETRANNLQSLNAWKVALAQNREHLALLVGAESAGVQKPSWSSDEARANLAQAQQALAAMERAAGSWDTVQTARDTAAALRAEKPAYEDMKQHCVKAVGKLLDAATEDFCKQAQAYLPERFRIGLQLHDGDKEVFRLGFWRGNVLHTILSGTEYDALCASVAMVVAGLGGVAPTTKKGRGRPPARTTHGNYYLVIPEDRDRDPETLRELMVAWRKFPGQIILESTKVPKGGVPAGWTLVDLDEWRKQFEKAGGEGVREDKAEEGVREEVKAEESKSEAKWYYHPESESYARLTEAEYLASGERGLLVEIEGTDDGAPDRHRAEQDDPNTPAASPPVPPAPVVGAEIPVDLAGALSALGHKDTNISKFGPKLRKLLVDEQVAGAQVMVLGNSCVIYGPKNAPARTLTLD